jgi:hypothetical protein
MRVHPEDSLHRHRRAPLSTVQYAMAVVHGLRPVPAPESSPEMATSKRFLHLRNHLFRELPIIGAGRRTCAFVGGRNQIWGRNEALWYWMIGWTKEIHLCLPRCSNNSNSCFRPVFDQYERGRTCMESPHHREWCHQTSHSTNTSPTSSPALASPFVPPPGSKLRYVADIYPVHDSPVAATGSPGRVFWSVLIPRLRRFAPRSTPCSTSSLGATQLFVDEAHILA